MVTLTIEDLGSGFKGDLKYRDIVNNSEQIKNLCITLLGIGYNLAKHHNLLKDVLNEMPHGSEELVEKLKKSDKHGQTN